MKTSYPRVKKLYCDVLALGGNTESCILNGGKIMPALSAKYFQGGFSASPTGAFYTQSDGRMYLYGKNSLNFTDDFKSYFTMGVTDSEPFAYTTGGEGNYGFITATRHYKRAGNAYSVTDCAGGVRDGVYKNGRIFGVDVNDAYTVKWSSAGGAEWEGDAGYVRLNTRYGEILKLIVLNDAAAAVCKHGIAMISAYGTPENFKISYPCPQLPEIYKNTACVAGAKLYFAAADGVYAFNGEAAEKLPESYLKLIKTPKFAAALGNNYFLLGADGLGKSTVAVYDTLTGESYYFFSEADVIAAGDRVYGLGNQISCVFEEGGKFLFESKNFNFGAKDRKVLSAIEITAENGVDVEIKSGVKSRIYRGVNGVIRPKMYGKSFKIIISGYGEVSAVNACAEAVDGV